MFVADEALLENIGKVNIEAFHALNNVTSVENNRDLTFTALLYTPPPVESSSGGNKSETTAEFYAKTIANLKAHAPRLRTVNLYGGHLLYAFKTVESGADYSRKFAKKNSSGWKCDRRRNRLS